MSESYEDYESEYDGYLSRVRSFLASTRSLSTLKESERLIREARRCATAMQGLAEVEGDPAKVEEARRRMEREVRPLADEVARALEAKQGGGGEIGNSSIRSGSTGTAATATGSGMNDLRSELFGGGSARATGRSDAVGDGVFGNSSGGYQAPTLDDKEAGGIVRGEDGATSTSDTDRLILDSERLLLESQALCADTEQVGASTLQTMGEQREQLYMASSHLQRARNATDQAKRILKQMSNRALRNKLFLYGVIAALILANCVVLYRIFTKSK